MLAARGGQPSTKGTASDVGSWLSAQSVKIFTFGPYKLLMKKMMKSLSIGYIFFRVSVSVLLYSSQA